jgi:hypothetical protein
MQGASTLSPRGLLALLALALLRPACSQACGGAWGLCALVAPSPATTALVNLNPYSNAVTPIGAPVPYAFVSAGDAAHSTAPYLLFVGAPSQAPSQLHLVALNASDGALASATLLPAFQPGLLLAFASELGLAVLAGRLAGGGAQAVVVGTVAPGVQESWVEHARLDAPGGAAGLGGAATYVPRSQELLFAFAQAGALHACALAAPGGACRSAPLPPGLTLTSLAFSPQDAQALAVLVNASGGASLQALDPQTLALSPRGALNANFTALPRGGAPGLALLLGGGVYSGAAWLAAPASAAAAAAAPPPATYVLMPNLCSGGGAPPVNQSSGLPLPLCGGGGGEGGQPCPLALGALYAPPPPPPPAPALDCSFAASYPQQLVVYALAPGQAIAIDGRLDDAAWAEVGWTRDFVDATTATPPPLATRVKARWDDEYLYLGAYLQEPHVCANITYTCHCRDPAADQNIYDDNDFEAFIDPDGSCRYYKELEINAANATWDICLTRPYSNHGYGNSTPAFGASGWDFPLPLGRPGTYRAAVHTDGALNVPASRPSFWSVEMALPLASLAFNTTARVPPAPGDYWRALFAREAWNTTVSADGSRYLKTPACQTCATPGAPSVDNWAWTHLPAASFHMPEAYGFLQFADSAVNATPARAAREWPGRALAAAALYAQQAYAADHCGAYAGTSGALLPYFTGAAPEALVAGACTGGAPLGVSAGWDGAAHTFNVTVPGTVADPGGVVTVNEERHFRVLRQ